VSTSASSHSTMSRGARPRVTDMARRTRGEDQAVDAIRNPAISASRSEVLTIVRPPAHRAVVAALDLVVRAIPLVGTAVRRTLVGDAAIGMKWRSGPVDTRPMNQSSTPVGAAGNGRTARSSASATQSAGSTGGPVRGARPQHSKLPRTVKPIPPDRASAFAASRTLRGVIAGRMRTCASGRDDQVRLIVAWLGRVVRPIRTRLCRIWSPWRCTVSGDCRRATRGSRRPRPSRRRRARSRCPR
jgi:hypothetical protein